LSEPGEDPEQTAYREFKEETGIDLKALGLQIVPFATYSMPHKHVKVFLCEDDNELTVGITPVCHSLVRPGYPEIDKFAWVTAEKAQQMVFKTQKSLFV
jgi:8-oxo-dGTP pyrophosphatase MutT (NUDIX family)